MSDRAASLALGHEQETYNVDRVNSLIYDDFINKYLKPCKPVIIKNATENWQAHQVWDYDFFKKIYSNCQVTIDGKIYNFLEFIDLVLNETNNNNPAPYLREINIPINFPELMVYLQPDIQYTLPNRLTNKLLPRVLERSWGMRKGMVELLIGGKGSG
ncbi:MAG: hypothetical protein QNJ65_23555, partial [Xenococcaceae cyanobacterium MO_234.B1]|nr:hypothetical protein [Xenococcaceae cyanobacterium MO_234.B1]